jgi:tRNA-(ms[2]io[6]A)-hydroxylase
VPHSKLLEPIKQFLRCETPLGWIDEATKKENLAVILIDHLICELKAAQSAMFLIRKYAVDKQSSDALLEWLKPFETLIYKREGNWRDLAAKNKLTKAVIPKSDSAYGQDLVDKMVMLIKEELHHFYQVLEIMDEYGIEYQSITPCRYAKGMLRHVKTFEPDALVDKLIVGAYIEARSCERFAALAPHVDKRLGDFYISLLRSEARHYQDYLTLAQEIAGFKFHSGTPVNKSA